MISVERYNPVLNLSKRSYGDIPKGVSLSNSIKIECYNATTVLVKSIILSAQNLGKYDRFLGVSLDVDDSYLLPVKVLYIVYKSEFVNIQCKIEVNKSLSYWNLMNRLLYSKPYKRDFNAYSMYWKICLAYLLKDYDEGASELLLKGEL